jgi:hypothetical protein
LPQKSRAPLVDCLRISLIVVSQSHDVVLAQIIAQLNFDKNHFGLAAISQAMIGFGRNVDVLTFFQLQLPITTDHVGHTPYNDPMLAAPRMSLQA